MYNLIIGCHVSLAAKNEISKKPYLEGSLLEAISYDANAFMIYTGAPQTTKRISTSMFGIDEFHKLVKEHNFPIQNIIIHAPYILNLANPDPQKRGFAITFLAQELKRANDIGVKIIVVHPGNHLENTVSEGIQLSADSINRVFEIQPNVKIAIETMAGKGSEICFKFEQVKELISLIKPKFQDRIGVCMDSCHIHDAGYDIENNLNKVMEEFDQIVGFDKVLAVHVNGSKNPCGARKDRHENLGKGFISQLVLLDFIYYPKLNNVPKILETPYIDDVPPYAEEIKYIKTHHRF